MAMDESDFLNHEIRYLGDLARLRLEPGDMLVLSCPQPLSFHQVERLREQMRKFMGDAAPVLGGGIKLGVVSDPRKA